MDLKVLKCNNADHQPSQELQEYIINDNRNFQNINQRYKNNK